MSLRGFQCCKKEALADPSSCFIAAAASNPNNHGGWEEVEFVNSQGLKLRAYHVQPSDSSVNRGIVILVHGIKCNGLFEFMNADEKGQHCVFQGTLAERLSILGFHVFTYDQQSHGLSEGLHGYRSYVDDVDDLATDLLQCSSLANKWVSKASVSTAMPTFAVGESMGGGVVCRAAQMDPAAFRGLVLLAPMLSVERLAKKKRNRILKPIGMVLSHLAPASKLMYLPPSDKFPEIHTAFQQDSLNDKSGYIRTRTALKMDSFCQSIIHTCAEIDTPFLTMHSKDDTLVDPDSSEVLYRDSTTTDKEYMHVDDMWHALLHEPGSAEVVAKIAKWIDDRA